MSDTTTPGFLASGGAALDEDASLNATLQIWVRGITGLSGDLVRPRWQAFPAPQPDQTTNWASVGFTTEQEDTNAWFGHDPAGGDGTGSSTMQRHEQLEATITFYGPNANSYASLLLDGALVGQNRDVLTVKGIVLAGSGSVRTMPELIGQTWIRRADATFTLRRQIERTYAIRTILSAPTATTYDYS